MKFSDILLLASIANAAPIIEKRQQDTIAPVTNAISQLETETAGKFEEIKSAIEDDEQLDPQETITSGFEAIMEAIEKATTALEAATPGTEGAAAGAAPNVRSVMGQDDTEDPGFGDIESAEPFTFAGSRKARQVPDPNAMPEIGQEQIDQITESVESIKEFIRGAESTLDVVENQTAPEVVMAVQGNVDELKQSIEPLTVPFFEFISSVKDGIQGGDVDVSALDDAVDEVKGIVTALAEKLGLDGLDEGTLDGVLAGTV